jgi:hypothetical protein
MVRAAPILFLVMAPFGPLYFLEKESSRPAREAGGAPAPADGVFLDRSKAQLRVAQRAMRERNSPLPAH